MRTLITGAAGQLGTDVAAAFAEAGDEVLASDVREAPHWARELDWRVVDVTKPHQVDAAFRAFEPQRVVHLAALLSARGEQDPELAYAVNQGGTYNLLEAARVHGAEQFLFTSSIAVYGPGTPSPAKDEAELLPRTLYGATKAAGEILGTYYKHRHGLDFRGVRYPGIVGASMPGGGTSDYAVYMFFEAARGKPYAAFCQPDTRIPLMYDRDSARALVDLAAAPRQALTRSVYNVGGFNPAAWEIAAALQEALPSADISFEPDPERQRILDSWPNSVDDKNARDDWNWRPRFDLSTMTKDLVPRMQDLAGTAPVLPRRA